MRERRRLRDRNSRVQSGEHRFRLEGGYVHHDCGKSNGFDGFSAETSIDDMSESENDGRGITQVSCEEAARRIQLFVCNQTCQRSSRSTC